MASRRSVVMAHRHARAVLGWLLACLWLGPAFAAAASANREILIGLQPGVAPGARAQALRHAADARPLGSSDLRAQARPGRITLLRVRLAEGVDPNGELARLRHQPGVAFAEPNYPLRLFEAPATVIPNDLEFGKLNHLRNLAQPGADIHATEAWAWTTGAKRVLVAVIDTGIDYLHEDLAANIWVNEREIAGNGLDDDGNGYADDLHGFDFVSNDSDPMDDQEHGTHVAGLIGAQGDNELGVAGVSWKVSLMALKAFDETGNGTTADAIEAIHYAIDNGARIINASWGIEQQSRALEEAVRHAAERGVLMIAAAGNERSDNPNFPAGYEEVISVAATDERDGRAGFSNYGPDVDLAAPGMNLISTLPENRYGASSGTSMAAPLVAGAAALILARFPEYTREDVRSVLLNSTDDVFTDRPLGRGRLNVLKAVLMDQPPPLARLVLGEQLSGRTEVNGTASGSFATGYALLLGLGNTPTNWTTLSSSTRLVTDGLLGVIDTDPFPDGPAVVRLVVTNANGKVGFDLARVRIINNNISTPRSADILPGGRLIEVRGTVYGTNGTYRLEYGQGLIPKTWTELARGESSTVIDRVLGRWDTAALPGNAYYALRLTVEEGTERHEFTAPAIYLDNGLKTGWPRYLPTAKDYPHTDWRMARAADLEGDGPQELVLLDTPSLAAPAILRVFDSAGAEKWARPIEVGSGPDIPAIGDVDGDGRMEIFVDGRRQIFAFDAAGQPREGWPIEIPAGSLAKVLADVDRDGRLDLITYAQDPLIDTGFDYSQLRIYNAAGTLTQEWLFPWCGFTNDVQKIFPLAANLDDEPGLEIVAVSGCNEVVCLKPGEPNPRWRTALRGAILSSPIAGDLDGDGKLEIVVATAPERGFESGGLYVLSANGRIWEGWPILEEASFTDAPALGDLNEDGRLEIAVMSAKSLELHVIETDGFEADGWPVKLVNGVGRFSPAIAPVDESGWPRVLAPSPGYLTLALQDGDTRQIGGVLAFDYTARRVPLGSPGGAMALPIEGSSAPQWRKQASPLIADLDGDGSLELFASSIQDRTFGTALAFKRRSTLYLWDLPARLADSALPWPMFGNNPRNNAVYQLPPLPPDPGPTNLTRAVRDRLISHEDHAVVLPVLRNDINAAGGTLEIASYSQPAHGRLDREASGQLFYQPDQDFSGLDSFQYTVRDRRGAESTTEVKLLLRPFNDLPVAVDQILEMTKNKELNIVYQAVDPEGDPLTYRIVSPPSHGELWNYPTIGNYVPPKGFFGSDSFAYVANDGLHDSAPATVQITIINRNNPPEAFGQSVVTKTNRLTAIELAGRDSDEDPILFELTVPPANGTASLTNATVIFQPAAEFSGEDRFSFRTFDGSEYSAPASVTIRVIVTNYPPLAADRTVPVSPGAATPILLTATDLDGDPLTFRIETSPTHGALTGEPPSLVYTPEPGYVGPDRFTYTVTDSQTTSAPAQVALLVARQSRPPIALPGSLTTLIDTPLRFQLPASDPDQDPLRGLILKGPGRGRVFGTGVDFTYVPETGYLGPDFLTFRVWDGRRYSPTARLDLSIVPFLGAPQPIFGPVIQGEQGRLSSELSVRSDRPFAIEASTNLVDWAPLLGPQRTETGTFLFHESSVSSPRRFFRAISSPEN